MRILRGFFRGRDHPKNSYDSPSTSTANCPVKSHDHGDSTVNFLCGFFFIRLDISGRVTPDENVIHHPPKNGDGTSVYDERDMLIL